MFNITRVAIRRTTTFIFKLGCYNNFASNIEMAFPYDKEINPHVIHF